MFETELLFGVLGRDAMPCISHTIGETESIPSLPGGYDLNLRERQITLINNLYLTFKQIQMNRLVIIGNGFDLAHGLPTGYCDFIDWYWKSVLESISQQELDGATYADNLIDLKLAFKSSSAQIAKESSKSIIDFTTLNEFIKTYSEAYEKSQAEYFDRCKLGFINSFFGIVCKKRSIQNWVDIENEYYKLLKDCLKEEDNSKVRELNEEFEQVKNLLEKYLNENVAERYDFQIPNEDYKKILKIFSVEPLYLSKNPNHIYFKEFSKEDYNDLITFDNKLTDSYYNRTLHQDFNSGEINQRNLILNFNYTPVVDKYVSEARNGTHLHRNIAFGETWQIQIHGKLFDVENPINFGFGDEMDEGYNLLEKKMTMNILGI